MDEKRRRFRRRLRRPRLPRVELRKAMFVLPNLFTVSSIFCGFYAIIVASGASSSAEMVRASLAIFFGIFFDMADGRVARLTRTQSEFGMHLDSLADVVTFGVSPAVVVYEWALAPLGLPGAVIAFVFVACGALRLARFNVLASRGGGTSTDFIGLPIPLAAGVVVSLVMFHQRVFAAPVTRPTNVVVLVFVLSYLMVSHVRYRSFKKVRPSPRNFLILGLVLATFGAVTLLSDPTFALFSFFCAYVLLGLVEEVVFFRRRRREEPPKAEVAELQPPPPPAGPEGGTAPHP